VVGALLLRFLDLEGLLLGFLLGQVTLLAGMLVLIVRGYPARSMVSFEMFGPRYLYPSLMLVGLFYNAGVWADKAMFWFYSGTGSDVIGPLRASLIYDIPVFLSYLSLIPGMATLWSTTAISMMRCAKGAHCPISRTCATRWCS